MSSLTKDDADRHTPLPWTVSNGTAVVHFYEHAADWLREASKDNPVVTHEWLVGCNLSEADARRIVACVNLLRDCGTAQLEELVREERELEVALALADLYQNPTRGERSKG